MGRAVFFLRQRIDDHPALRDLLIVLVELLSCRVSLSNHLTACEIYEEELARFCGVGLEITLLHRHHKDTMRSGTSLIHARRSRRTIRSPTA